MLCSTNQFSASPHEFKQQFLTDGYLIFSDFIPKFVCEKMIEQANHLVEQFDEESIKSIFSIQDQGYMKDNYFLESKNKIHYFFEKNAIDVNGNFAIEKKYAINKLGHGLHQIHPFFYCFSQLYPITQLLSQLDIVQPTLLQSMYIFKQPFIGDEVTCHQDSTFLTLVNDHVVGLWFALEDATIHNGCLWVIPNIQQETLHARMIRQPNNRVYIEEYDKNPWDLTNMVPLEVKQGSMILLHGLLPHMSKLNQSNRSRHAYTLHVKSKHQTMAVGNWLAPDGKDNFMQL